jgi:predicted transcriptional regulator of viral defense system
MPDGARTTLSAYALRLQASGRLTFSREEAIAALGVSDAAFLKAAERLQKRHALLSPRRGFYVIVPARFLSWEGPPADWYIDPLMRHEGRAYYVGLLKAAELHGAAHHAVMEFQVVTDRQLPRIRRGRSVIAFYFRKDLEGVSGELVDRKTETGTMKLSSPELTAFDLVRYVHAVGGVDAVATVLAELGEGLRADVLARIAPHFERAVVQRLGYLLDRLGAAGRTEALHSWLLSERNVAWVELEPRRRGARSTEPLEKSEHWRVLVHRRLEPDE